MLKPIDHGPLRELRFDHPPVNALRGELLDELARQMTVAPDDGVRGLVISGAPGFFSAGLDVPYLLGLDADAAKDNFRALLGAIRAIGTSTMPVAAAITGHSPAGGAVLAIFCDYRVMAQGDFKIGLNEVQVGLPVPPIIHATVSRLVGIRAAERLCVEARMLGPNEAQAAGLVDELAAPDEVTEKALAWCERVAAQPPTAMLATRATARADVTRTFEQCSDQVMLAALFDAWTSEETQAAMRALVRRLGA